MTETTTDISLIADAAWATAKRRAEIIRPLAAMSRCPLSLVRTAAFQLDLSERQIFTLIKRCRERDGALDALIVRGSQGGKGHHRLPKELDALIQSTINDIYLTSQRLSAAAVAREIVRRCHVAGLKPPSGNTIRRRLNTLTPEDRRQRGESTVAGKAISGRTPAARNPLDTVQMDHTKVDIIIVDPLERKPIGRPWLTVAIDVFSRSIVGMHLSLEAPSATSVGLCLVHAASDKSQWLVSRGVTTEWPIQGKPKRISVDNGAEFHSTAFERGCEQHGIEIHWRPPGQPQFGGIVERVIGTLMKLVHELPGTTFSNPTERNRYDSDRMACLTLEELEHWMAIAITGVYHLRAHSGLDGENPLHRFKTGISDMESEGQSLPLIRNPRAFLIDFLPIVRRTMQRNGVTVDRVAYYSPALKPWISLRDPTVPVLIRRDPRDISRIYLFDPTTSGYIEIPYRDLSRPSISLWEHRLAIRRLREKNRQHIDEAALFRAVEELRDIEKTAARNTRSARRNQVRREQHQKITPKAVSISSTAKTTSSHSEPPLPFSEIESW